MVAAAQAAARGPKRFVALDSLRGVAAITVALYHLFGTGFISGSTYVRNGDALVDLFFVLSGFVIAGAYGSKLVDGFSFLRFMALRIGRLWPLHITMLLVFVAYQALVWASHDVPLYQNGVLLDHGRPGELLATVFLVQAYWVQDFGTWGGRMWNGPSWSISVELLLYALAGLAWRFVGRPAWILAPLCSAIVFLFLRTLADPWQFAGYLPLRGIAGFGLGIGAWQIWLRLSRSPVADLGLGPATAMELAAVALAALVICGGEMSDRLLLLDASFALLILVFAFERGYLSALLGTRPFVSLGLWSYSIYMVHLVVEYASFAVLRRLGFIERIADQGINRIDAGPILGEAISMAIILLVVATAALTWRFVEEPSRRWSRKVATAGGVSREESAAPSM